MTRESLLMIKIRLLGCMSLLSPFAINPLPHVVIMVDPQHGVSMFAVANSNENITVLSQLWVKHDLTCNINLEASCLYWAWLIKVSFYSLFLSYLNTKSFYSLWFLCNDYMWNSWLRCTRNLEKKPYHVACDYWSIGVVLFMLLSGCPPFFDEDNFALFEKIKKVEYNFDAPTWSLHLSYSLILVHALLL